ncbi:hypothetical protein HYW20_01975 [Candidatus Woesearchaeota archaeon]|nr:hypothetical protein [Candidatus Woesearchaeota archaeon]
MDRNGTHAILINGDENRHLNNINIFKQFLLNELTFDPMKVHSLDGRLGSDYLYNMLSLIFEEINAQEVDPKVVMVYQGHGDETGIRPNKSLLSYNELRELIPPNITFMYINDTCNSGNAASLFEGLRPLYKKGMVLTSASREEDSYGGLLLRTLMEHYRHSLVFRRTEIGIDEELKDVDYVIVINFIKPPEGKGLFDPEDITVGYTSSGRRIVDPRKSPYGFVGATRTRALKYDVKGEIQHPQRAGKTLDYLLFKNH